MDTSQDWLAPLSMEFSRQEYGVFLGVWVAIPFFRGSFSPRDQTRSPALHADSLPSEPLGKPQYSSAGKASTCDAGDIGDVGSTPGSVRSPGGGNGNTLQYFCLKNPMNRGALWATAQRVTKSQTRLSNLAFTDKKTKKIIGWLAVNPYEAQIYTGLPSLKSNTVREM